MTHPYILINENEDSDLITEDDKDEKPLISDNSIRTENILNRNGIQGDESYSSQFHCHENFVTHQDVQSWKKLLFASILCLIFMIVEFVGGYIAGSSAVMSDAGHLLSDFIGFVISLISIFVSKKKPTKRMTFGYHRMQVLGALMSVVFVWILAGTFIVIASQRLWNPTFEIKPDLMIFLASFGIAVNICMGIILHGVCFKHNHSHGLQLVTNDSNENINVRAAAIHVLGDLIQSVGVLIAAFILKYYPDAKIADPICTLLFSVLVLFSTVCVARDAFWILLEGSTKNPSVLIYELTKIPHVKHLHDFRMWTVSPGKDVVNVHLAVDSNCDRDLVLRQATGTIKKFSYIFGCTVQVEPYVSSMSSCEQCTFKYC